MKPAAILKKPAIISAKILLVLFILFAGILIPPAARCQCTSGSGTPIIDETFGSGANTIGAQLSNGVTNMQFVQSNCPDDGQYSIVNYTSGCNKWHTVIDHTGDGNGYFMLINASFQPSDFFVQTVGGLCEGTTYEFSSWIINMNPRVGGILPNITFTIEKTDGTILNSYITGDIPETVKPGWKRYGFYFTTPPSISTVVIRMHNNARGGGGNDLALDDIAFSPAGPKVVIRVEGSKGDTIHTVCNMIKLSSTVESCYTKNTYQWQTSIDGKTWTNIIAGAAGPTYLLSLSGDGIYRYRLNVAENGNIGSINCRVNSNNVTVIYDPPILKDISLPVCQGSSYQLPSGKTVKAAGLYRDTLFSKRGCDSVITIVNLKIKSVKLVDTIVSICSDGVYKFPSGKIVQGPGIYKDTLRYKTGCDSVITTCFLKVTTVTPIVTIRASANSVYEGSSITFTATPGNGGGTPVFQWLLNGNPVGTDSASFTINTLTNGDVVSCIMTSNAVCAAPSSVTSNCIKVNVWLIISIPNAFSPNGDGINDFWDVKNLPSYQNCLVDIFDRYGQKVYSSRGYAKPWDGKLNGKRLPFGTYYYIINFNNGSKPSAGFVVILR